MSNLIKHPYHLVEMSPWPFFSAMGAMGLTTGMVVWFHMKLMTLFWISFILILMVMQQWWRDVSREGSFQGIHTLMVETGLRWGMVLFILSEVMFFFSFFWAFFHSSLSPSIELGCVWPPAGVVAFNPFSVPLMNTVILLSSGVSVTWSHHAMMLNNYSSSLESLLITVILGFYFTIIQLLEYLEASFSISDSVFGSTFFVATGFHGLHVIIGSLFLMATYLRMSMGSLSSTHHFGFEAAAWYWHFVDVVWLFLFISIYWWGGKI